MPIKVILKGFRCYLDREFLFDERSIILLKGPSGIGKSTIFQAIYWCLYGSLKGVYHNSVTVKQCSVQMELPMTVSEGQILSIYRQKKPQLFRVLIKEKNRIKEEYEDRVAQQIINEKFGDKDLWRLCCYIAPKSDSFLLSGIRNNNERMSLLNMLAFNEESPEDFINKIEQEITTVNSNFIALQAKFNAECQIFNNEVASLSLNNNDNERFIPVEDRQNIKNELVILKKVQCQLSEKFNKQQQIIGMRSSLEESRNQIIENLKSLPVSTSKIEDLEKQLYFLRDRQLQNSLYESYREKTFQIKEICRILETLQLNGEILDSGISEVNLQEMRILWSQYYENMKKCQDINVKYDSLSIENEIKKIKKIIEDQPIIQAQRDYNRLKSTIKNIPTGRNVCEIEVEINHVREHLSELQRSKDVLNCPKCLTPLRIINSGLMTSDFPPVSSEIISLTMKQLEQLTDERNRQIKHESERKHLLRQLSLFEQKYTRDWLESFSGQELSPSEINDLQIKLLTLSQIKVIEQPTMTESEIERLVTYRKMVHEKEILETEIEKLDIHENEDRGQVFSDQTITQEITRLTLEIEQIKMYQTQKRIYIEQLEQIDKRLQLLTVDETIAGKLDEITGRIKTMQENLTFSETMDKFYERQRQLEKDREILQSMADDLTNLHRFKDLAIEVECQSLESIVSHINLTLSEIIPQLFDQPMTISLQLFKTLKSKNRTKPTVNISIIYQGMDMEYSQLSTGQADRCSLAITIALAKMSSFPLLLLDECVASLHGDLREICVNVLREHLSENKTIISVSHGDVEGLYDQVINLE